MKHLSKILCVLLVFVLSFSLSACGKSGESNSDKKDSTGMEKVENSSETVMDNGLTDGIDDHYAFGYELTFDSETDVDGVMVSEIRDDTVKDVSVPKTRVSKYNDPMPVIGIYSGAFVNNTTIESVVLPDTICQIQSSAFEGCANLSRVEMQEGVWLIGMKAFYGCGSLKSIKLPMSVKTIEGGAFGTCTVLETIEYAGTMAQWKAITCKDMWTQYTKAFSVVCSDGTLQIDDKGNIV